MVLLVRGSQLVQDARTGKRITPGWLAYILVFIGFIYIGQSVALSLLASLWTVIPGSAAYEIIQALSFAAPLLLLFAWIALYEKRPLYTLGYRQPNQGIGMLFIGIAVGVVLLSIPLLITWLTGAYEFVPGPTDSISGWAVVPILAVILGFIILQAGTEETIMRGFLLQNSGLKLPGWLAIVLPAFLFTAIHNVFTNPLAFASIFLFALIASFVALRLGTLWLIAGIHTGWNFAQGNIYGIAIGHLPPNSASLLFLRPAPDASDWLTGGDIGIAASMPIVITLLILTAVTFVWFRQASRSISTLPRAPEQGKGQSTPAK